MSMLNDSRQQVTYRSATLQTAAAFSNGLNPSVPSPNSVSRAEVETMIRSALNGLFITAVCNDDGTITITLNGK
jgi:hypothetical protein